MKLYPFQIEGVRHLKSGRKKLLLDEMGLGKTVQTVVAFDRAGAKRVIIVCPAGVRTHWAKEINKWCRRKRKIQVLMKMKEQIDPNVEVLIMSYDALNDDRVYDQVMEKPWTVAVIDEIHLAKTLKSKRGKRIYGYRRTNGLYQRSRYWWGLSGTVIKNQIDDLHLLFMRVNKKAIPLTYQRDKELFRWHYTKHPEKMRELLFDSGLALRREKKDVLKELPAKLYKTIEIEYKVRIADRGSYNEIEEKYLEHLSKKRREEKPVLMSHSGKETENLYDTASINCRIDLGLEIGEIATYKRLMGEAKVAKAYLYIKKLVEAGEKVVVFAWHRSVVSWLEFEFDMAGIETCVYSGKSTPKQKEKAKKQFIEGSAQVMFAQIASAGTGLDGLQFAARHAVFVEMPWTYSEVAQAVDRLHRIGQLWKVIAHILVGKDAPIEGFVLNKILSKEKTFKAVLGTRLTASH